VNGAVDGGRNVWYVRRLHHVAVAHDGHGPTEDAVRSFLGPATHTEEGPGFLERMYDAGDCSVQTLEATGDGVVERFLQKRGPGLHHIAFEVDAIDHALADLTSAGVPLIDREARAGGMGTRIAFLHPSAFGGVLVELVEESRPPAVAGSVDEGGS
jgi:methylmalonyl-CoA/ethylmalonyl-CoA epimerase